MELPQPARTIDTPTPKEGRTAGLFKALLLSLALAAAWWLFVYCAVAPTNKVLVWHDQEVDFTQVSRHLDDPYQTPGFATPPWTAVLLIPFGLMPLPLAVFVQLCLYFMIITGVIFKYGGDIRTVALTLTSFIAFQSSIELNIDWLVYLGLLLPPALSGPFLLIKPQNALGVWITFERKSLVRTVGVVLVVLVGSLLIWGFWPQDMMNAIQRYTLAENYIGRFNLAPLSLMPVPISLAIGACLGWRAFRRKDPALAILAWLFFVPYIPFYGLLLPLALLHLRAPRFGLIVNIVTWVIYGGVTFAGLFLFG